MSVHLEWVLRPDHAVDDVDAGLLQALGPGDVALLVETGLELDQDRHLDAPLGRPDEVLGDDRVTGRAVQGHLDREDVGVVGGLTDELLDRGHERVVRVVHEHVLAPDDLEEAALLLQRVGQAGLRDRHPRLVLQLRPVEPVQCPQPGEVERRAVERDVVLGEIELGDEELQDAVRRPRLDLQPHGASEAAAAQLHLQGDEEVVGLLLLDGEVGVAGDPEHPVVHHRHPREQRVEVRRDQVLQEDEALAVGEGDEPGQGRRHLHPGEALGAVEVVEDRDGQVERQVGDVGERVRRVDTQWGEHREDPFVEDLVEVLAVVEVEVRPAAHDDPVGLDGRHELAEVQVLLLADQVLDPVADLQQLLARGPPVRRELRQPGCDLVLEGGHPDLEELVEVGREDGGELQPLQERRAGIGGQREHPLVEVEPGQLPVEEPRWRAVSRIHQGRHPFQRSPARERPTKAPCLRRHPPLRFSWLLARSHSSPISAALRGSYSLARQCRSLGTAPAGRTGST